MYLLGNIIDFLEWIAFMFFEKIRCNIFISEVRPEGRGIDIKNLPIEYLKSVQTQILEFNDYMHKGNYFHYEIDKLLSLIDYAIQDNKNSLDKLYNEIVLLDGTRNQSYKNYLDSSLIKILENV